MRDLIVFRSFNAQFLNLAANRIAANPEPNRSIVLATMGMLQCSTRISTDSKSRLKLFDLWHIFLQEFASLYFQQVAPRQAI